MLRRAALVARHALAMWRALSHPKNAAKGHWGEIPPCTLFQLATAEMQELAEAMSFHAKGRTTPHRVEEEAADVSAYLSMLVDNCKRR